MKTRTQVQWRVADIGGTYYTEDGYSKYNQRWRDHYNGQLPDGEEVYGYEQALLHAVELKTRHNNLQLKVVCITTVTTSIDV